MLANKLKTSNQEALTQQLINIQELKDFDNSILLTPQSSPGALLVDMHSCIQMEHNAHFIFTSVEIVKINFN